MKKMRIAGPQGATPELSDLSGTSANLQIYIPLSPFLLAQERERRSLAAYDDVKGRSPGGRFIGSLRLMLPVLLRRAPGEDPSRPAQIRNIRLPPQQKYCILALIGRTWIVYPVTLSLFRSPGPSHRRSNGAILQKNSRLYVIEQKADNEHGGYRESIKGIHVFGTAPA